jgi:hypothetical protein
VEKGGKVEERQIPSPTFGAPSGSISRAATIQQSANQSPWHTKFAELINCSLLANKLLASSPKIKSAPTKALGTKILRCSELPGHFIFIINQFWGKTSNLAIQLYPNLEELLEIECSIDSNFNAAHLKSCARVINKEVLNQSPWHSNFAELILCSPLATC